MEQDIRKGKDFIRIIVENDIKNNKNSNKKEGPFNWSTRVQGFILSSFFYGNVLTMVS